ncbi:hypothetical protein AHiyo4_13220 [Arthrobacter sp. Hiyo4]|nr:hypothetical protein AHiyo4_13220 [Arthrobacter sp. Hiyo4]
MNSMSVCFNPEILFSLTVRSTAPKRSDRTNTSGLQHIRYHIGAGS